MREELSNSMKVDPSDIKQSFTEINIKLHCYRYWMLSEWECANMAFPFWRLYHNTIEGASLKYRGITTGLTQDKVLIIPPDTSFSTSLKGISGDAFKESIIGKRISNIEEIADLEKKGMVDHLFIHFNLGIPFDSIQPEIYEFRVDGYIAKLLDRIKENNICVSNAYDLIECATINCLILSLLSKIPKGRWESSYLDKRILKTINFIENNIKEKLTNNKLADMINMAANSFARLFKENTAISLQQYIQKRRIEKALMMLHHSIMSIEEIASECGFFDRHHFSKVFKQVMKMSPVFYKRHLTF
jgi:AraC-like DNA-binding protein